MKPKEMTNSAEFWAYIPMIYVQNMFFSKRKKTQSIGSHKQKNENVSETR